MFFFRMLCFSIQSVHHSLPPLRKCNYLRDHDHPYINFQICGRRTVLTSIQLTGKSGTHFQLVQSTKAQEVKGLMQRLSDVWAGVEKSVIMSCPYE